MASIDDAFRHAIDISTNKLIIRLPMRIMRYRPTGYVLLACMLLVGLTACKSAEKSFNRANDLEAEGRYVEAARAYIEALKRDAELDAARLRLREVGPRAVSLYADEIASDEARGAYEHSLGVLDDLERLIREADIVGVTLDPPDNFGSYRSRLTDGAIREVLRAAVAAEDAGDWSEALRLYTRVEDRYGRSAVPERFRVLLRWAEADLDRDYPRAAFGHAQAAIDLVGPSGAGVQDALELQRIALDRGTQQVAVLPIWRLESWLRTAPSTALTDLNEIMTYDHWSAPPPFIAIADPVQLRRELRRLRYHNRTLSRTELAEVGRLFEADYTVFIEATKFVTEEELSREETREVRTRGRNAQDTTYTFQRVNVKLTAEVVFQLVDTADRTVVQERKVDVEVRDRIERAEYAGDYADLDLSSSQRALFDKDEQEEARRVLEDELIDNLSASMANAIYDAILARVR